MTGFLNERQDWQNSMLFVNEDVGEKRVRLIRNSRSYVFTDRDAIHRAHIHTYIHTYSEGNQERSRMNRLIARALCAGEIKKVDFQVDASVNASASLISRYRYLTRTQLIRARNINYRLFVSHVYRCWSEI